MPDKGNIMQPLERVLVTASYLAKRVDLSGLGVEVEVLADQPDRDGWIAKNGKGIRAIIAWGGERFGADRLAMFPDLGLISVAAAGMSGIDLEEARRRGIAVTNAGDLNSGEVAEFAVAMLLAHRRALFGADAWVRNGQWAKRRMAEGHSVSAERIGIVGLGHIGRAVADRLVPFGCEIRWWGPNPKPELAWPQTKTLNELANWASTLVIAVAGNIHTRGLIDRNVINALGADGLLVNVSRGFVVDETELKCALREGRLGGAALDVFSREPDDGSDWRHVPNVILTPHVGGSTREANERVMAGAVENLKRFLAGQPLERRVV